MEFIETTFQILVAMPFFYFGLFLFVFFLYEPLFVSAFGGTIGHTYSNIKIKREYNTGKNISFPIAIVRFTLKSLLGWISLLTVTSNTKKQAIHDFAAKSVVVIEDNKKEKV